MPKHQISPDTKNFRHRINTILLMVFPDSKNPPEFDPNEPSAVFQLRGKQALLFSLHKFTNQLRIGGRWPESHFLGRTFSPPQPLRIVSFAEDDARIAQVLKESFLPFYDAEFALASDRKIAEEEQFEKEQAALGRIHSGLSKVGEAQRTLAGVRFTKGSVSASFVAAGGRVLLELKGLDLALAESIALLFANPKSNPKSK